MNDLHPERLLENLEIAAAVQQGVSCFYAESRNQTVDGSSYCVALASQSAIVLRGSYSQFLSSILEQMELQQMLPHPDEIGLIANSL